MFGKASSVSTKSHTFLCFDNMDKLSKLPSVGCATCCECRHRHAGYVDSLRACFRTVDVQAGTITDITYHNAACKSKAGMIVAGAVDSTNEGTGVRQCRIGAGAAVGLFQRSTPLTINLIFMCRLGQSRKSHFRM